MAASESNPGPTLGALLNKSKLSTANMVSSEPNKDIIGMNRRKKFIQFSLILKSNEKTLL